MYARLPPDQWINWHPIQLQASGCTNKRNWSVSRFPDRLKIFKRLGWRKLSNISAYRYSWYSWCSTVRCRSLSLLLWLFAYLSQTFHGIRRVTSKVVPGIASLNHWTWPIDLWIVEPVIFECDQCEYWMWTLWHVLWRHVISECETLSWFRDLFHYKCVRAFAPSRWVCSLRPWACTILSSDHCKIQTDWAVNNLSGSPVLCTGIQDHATLSSLFVVAASSDGWLVFNFPNNNFPTGKIQVADRKIQITGYSCNNFPNSESNYR